jgi:hypothetical protein
MTMMTTEMMMAIQSKRAPICASSGERMKRVHFVKVIGEVPDLLSQEFRTCIRKVALVEDMPPNQPRRSQVSRGHCFRVSSTAFPRPRRAPLTYRRGQLHRALSEEY